MAKKTINYHVPMPAGRKLYLMAKDTIDALHRNFKTQGIFPGEVYPGYKTKNAKTSRGEWKSTGAGFDKIFFQINDALSDKDISVREATIDFFFNYYLKFVDMGVGRGRPIKKVKRDLDADFEVRYMEWNSQEGSTHRPAIMMEFRHLSRRMQRYWAEHYKYEAEVALLSGIEGITGERREKPLEIELGGSAK